MKKSLLFLALAVIAVGVNAQRFVPAKKSFVRTELKATPQVVDFRTPGFTTNKVMRAPRKLTTENPTVQAFRPLGFFWYIENWDGSQASNGLAIGPCNVDVTYEALFSAEKSKWLYVSGFDGDTPITQEKAVTESDSTLTLNLESGYYPAPTAVVESKVGASALKAKVVNDTTNFAADGMLLGFNSDATFSNQGTGVDMAVGNFDPTYYAGSANLGSYFATNSETANTNLAEKLFGGAKKGVISAKTLAFAEYFPMLPGSKALINRLDFTLYNPGSAPTDEDVVLAILPVNSDGNIGEPLTLFTLDNSTEFKNDQDAHWGHSCTFTPMDGTPTLIEGQDFIVQIANIEGSDYNIVPLTNVVTDTGDGNFAYALVSIDYYKEDGDGNFTEETGTDVFMQRLNVFNWGQDGLTNTTIGVKLHMTYDPVEIEEFETGIAAPSVQNDAANATFDLLGRRVMKAQKGIFIENGQKVIK